MSFEKLQLAQPILKAISECGHTAPTPIQAQAIPEVLAGHDLIASAQTGTGKTGAFVLPALQKLSSNGAGRRPGPRVLILTPTRELADQITQATRAYGRYLPMKSVAIYGGMPFNEQIRALSRSPELIIATPGRLLDHMDRGRIDLSHVEMFVLDEADRMLDMGFIEDVERICDAVPGDCQKLLFAATVGNATTKLAKGLMSDPVRVQVAPEKITHDKIEQRLHATDSLEHKNRLLQHICADKTVEKAIIFSATKRDADVIARVLKSEGHAAAALHGDMPQNARNRTMLNMRQGKIRLLVATDVAARGIDVTGITHVINFDLPRYAEDYVHRIGRTGRAGESGIAISFASRADLPYLDRIERYIGRNLNMQIIPGFEPAHPINRRSGDRKGPAGSKPSGPWGQNRSSGNGKPAYGSKATGSGNGGGYAAGGKRGATGRPWKDAAAYGSGSPGKPRRAASSKDGSKIFS